MPTAISGGGRIGTNTPAENALNALTRANDNLALRQLRLATGKRINSASDDVAGYITSRSLASRVGSLQSALNAVGDAKNVTAIAQDGLDNVNSLLTRLKIRFPRQPRAPWERMRKFRLLRPRCA